MGKINGNREYKSDVFSMLMQEKVYALETYNAVNGSDYNDPEEIEIIQLKHGVSLSMRNDAAFVLDMHVNYYEHQSTINPNMPLRMLIYYANDLNSWVESEEINLYGRKRIMLHTPHFVVFYNGKEKVPERMELKLSESFLQPTDTPELEVQCVMYNINPGFNTKLLEKTTALSEYMNLITLVRKNVANMSLEDAIHHAIDECISNGVLKDFLVKRRSEVEKAMTLDFTHERQLELTARDEREEGRRECQQKNISTYISKSGCTLSEALDFFDIVGEDRNLYHV